MAVRLVCPSCSASLSVKDEYAGRAVKCPKCGGIIPPSTAAAAPPAPSKPAAALPPPPAPEPEKPLFEEVDEPAKPKIKGRPTGKPAKADDDEDAPPKKRRDRNDNRDDADDRPARARRKRDADDEEDDRPAKKKGGSNTPIILGVVGFLLLTCCAGGGYGVYWFVNRVKEGVEQVKEGLETLNPAVSQTTYNQLKMGQTTRAEAETMLGKGKVATADDVKKAFPTDQKRTAEWTAKAEQGRVVIWRNGEDHLIALFHPNADGDARLQAKEYRPKNAPDHFAGGADDARFAQQYPVGKKPVDPPGKGVVLAPGTKVPAEELAREFKADPVAAAAKYVGKTFTVDGKLRDLEVVGGETRVILESGPGEGGMRVSCTMKGYLKTAPFSMSRGQGVRLGGRCAGVNEGTVSFADCAITGLDPDATPKVTASALIAAYRTDDAGDAKYKGKLIHVESAEVEKMPQDGALVVVPFSRIPGSKPPSKKIRVEYDPSYKPLFPQLKEGGLAPFHGRCEGVSGGEIVIKDAWFLPYIPVK